MRNPPERYIQVLQEHFSEVPQWFGSGPLAEPPVKIMPVTAPVTTNQDGKATAFQRWFHFKEAFSPSFVSAAINSLGYRPAHIIDPFGGSGTTAITAQLLAIDATTIEVNPFLADVIATKLSSLSAESLRSAAADFQVRLISTRGDLNQLDHLPRTFIETSNKKRWIYPIGVAERLSQYLQCINAIGDTDIRRFFTVVLGAVLVECSNVYVNGKGRRYRRAWQENEPTAEKLDQLFGVQFNLAFEDVLRFEGRPRPNISVVKGDSRLSLSNVTEPADLIIFSPPYPNSFDYTDIYNVELWMLGYINSGDDNIRLRCNTLRSHVQINRAYDLPAHRSIKLEETLAALTAKREQLWDDKIPAMIGGYFKDLELILMQSHRLLTGRGKVMMVVGDSRYAGVHIEVATILAELAKSIGFRSVIVREVRQMRSSAQQGGRYQLSESIVELAL